MRLLTLVFVLITGLIVAAPSQARVSCSDTQRFGQSLVRVGDSERKVIQAAGRPDLERQLENRQGGAAGYRMDYYTREQTIQIYISGGVVSRICRVRD